MNTPKGKRAETAIEANGIFKIEPLYCVECGGVVYIDEHDDQVCEDCGLIQ